MTAPARPTSIGSEAGYAAGTPGFGGGFGMTGWPEDASEQNLDLIWPLSIRVYDRMRRDPKLAQVLAGWTHPIRSASWMLDPTGCADRVVRLISDDLGVPILGDDNPMPVRRGRGRFSWKQHVRQALLALTYGHMPFEINCDADLLKSTGQARLRKLAPRMPQTLSHINVARDGGLDSIRQHPSGYPGEPPLGPEITVDRLVMYTNEREGGAWAGQSLLRSAYGAWYLKQDAMRTHAVSIRRNGMGIPVGEAPEGAGTAQIADIANAAQALRAGEYSGGAVPHGGRLRLLGVEGTLPDTLGFIRYCDEQMAGSALQEFLKLGSSASGNRALGDTFLWLFAMALNAAASDLIGDTTNEHVIEDLVDWNFGPTEPAPKLLHAQIDVDSKAVATAVSELVQAGALQMDDQLHDYLRQTLGLPAPTAPWTAPTPTMPAVPAQQPTLVAAAVKPPQRPASSTPPRNPSPEEQASGVDFAALDSAWQAELDALLPKWNEQRTLMTADLIAQVSAALDAADILALSALTPATGPGAALLEAAMLSLADAAALEAQAEAARQGVTVDIPAYPTETISARAQVVDELLGRSLADAVARQALARWTDGLDVDAVTAEIQTYLDGLSEQWLTDQLGGALTSAQNHARMAVMDNGPVRELYASELLDTATCVNCSAVDGHRFDSLAAAEADYPTGGFKNCLGGPRCRGTLVAIYDTEAT